MRALLILFLAALLLHGTSTSGRAGYAGDRTLSQTAATTPTPPPAPCVGDCNGNGLVTVDELVTAINIALGAATSADCPAYAGDGPVTIDRLIAAVNAALRGCPEAPARFPIGAYFWPDHAYEQTGSALADLDDFGINTVVAYYEYVKPDVPPFSGQPDCRGLVAEARASGIDFFIGSPQGRQVRFLDDATLTAQLQATVACVGSSPHYRGWMFDEPELTGYTPALLERVIGILRALDPDRRVWVNFNPYATDDQLRSFGALADILGFDVYPIRDGYGLRAMSLSTVGAHAERAQRAAPAAAAVWMIVQAFGYSDLDEGTQGRRPTPEELRFMVYDALLHGARGVVFFGSHQLRNTIPLDAPVWDVGVRTIARELKRISPVLLDGQPIGDITSQPASLAVRGLRTADTELLVTANPAPTSVTGCIRFGAGITDAYEIFDGRHPMVSQNSVQDDFPPYAVHVYRITR